LHVVHAEGIVHRDLKPANIFLCRGAGDDVHVKLIDFGVAKPTLDRNAPAMTREGFILGTPAYMSPEQITAQTADARSDLWGVVAIVYRALVGEPPFGSGAIGELGRRITKEPPTPASELVQDLPVEIDEWMNRGLSKRPDDRFQSTSELADALAEVARHAVKVSAPRVAPRTNLDSVETEAPTIEYRATPPTGPLPEPLRPPGRSSESSAIELRRSAAPRDRPRRLRHAADPTEELDVSGEESGSRKWIVMGAIAIAAGGVYWAYRASTRAPTSPTSTTSPEATASVSTFAASSASAASAAPSSSEASATAAPASESASAATTAATIAPTNAAPSSSSALAFVSPLTSAKPLVGPNVNVVPKLPIATTTPTFAMPTAPPMPPPMPAPTPTPTPGVESELPSEYQ
jgi:serine/threonine-protein kinase